MFFDRQFYYGQIPFDRKTRVLTDFEVETLNKHQVLQAHTQIYSANGDLSFVRKTLDQRKKVGRFWPTIPEDNSSLDEFINELEKRAYTVKPGTYTPEQWLSILRMENASPFGRLHQGSSPGYVAPSP